MVLTTVEHRMCVRANGVPLLINHPGCCVHHSSMLAGEGRTTPPSYEMVRPALCDAWVPWSVPLQCLVRKAWKLLPLILTPPWCVHTVQVMR